MKRVSITHAVGSTFLVASSFLLSASTPADELPARTATANALPKWIGLLDSIGHFTIQDLDARQWTDRDFVGKVLVVRLWSAHCAPCVDDFDEVQKFYESVRSSSSVAFVSMNLDAQSRALDQFFREFRKEYSFPVLLGRANFKIGPIPYTWIVDREGFLRDAFVGAPPNWPADTLTRAAAVGRKLSVSSLPAAVREHQRLVNAKDAEKAVQLGE